MQMHRSRRSLKDPAREGLAPCRRPNASLNCFTVYLLTRVRSPCLPNLAVYPELKPENNTSHFKAKVLNSKIIINNNILFYPYVSAVLLRLGRYHDVYREWVLEYTKFSTYAYTIHHEVYCSINYKYIRIPRASERRDSIAPRPGSIERTLVFFSVLSYTKCGQCTVLEDMSTERCRMRYS